MTTSTDRESWPNGMNIVNGHLAESIRAQRMIQPPNTFGYIHLAAEVERPHPLKPNSMHKKALLASLRNAADDLRKTYPDLIQRADLFDAFVIPPGSAEGRTVIEKSGYDVHVAAFDVVLLLECANPDVAQAVRGSPEFGAIKEMLRDASAHTHCFAGKNAKRIAEVDRDRDGIFLFNYFYAADIDAKETKGLEILLAVWEYTAGWWTKKANLDNSTPLQPLDGEASDYSLINHCRWDRLIDILPHLIFRPTLKKFVLANFTANDIVAMPILYRLAKAR